MGSLPAVTMPLVLFSTLCVCLQSWLNVVLETHVVARTTRELVFSTLPGIYVFVWQCNNVTTLQDAVTTLNRCVVEIKRAKFEDVVHSFFIIALSPSLL